MQEVQLDPLAAPTARVACKRKGGREEKPRLLLVLPLLVLAAVSFVPLFYAIYIAVHDIYLTQLYLGTPFSGLRNFIRVLTDPRSLHAFGVTFKLMLMAVSVELVLGLGIAVLLQTFFQNSAWVVTLIVLPMTVPKVVAALVWNVLYDPLIGVINYGLGLVGLNRVDWLGNPTAALYAVALVDIWQWTPFIILVLLAGLGTIPREPYEAAQIEGASGLQAFRYVTLPLLRPFLTVAVIFRALDAMRTFDYIYILTRGGPGLATETVDVFAYRIGIAESGQISIATAASLILLVITIALTTIWTRAMKWGEELY